MSHPFTLLVLARLREFYREPEALFWTFGFPILISLALGLAFRGGVTETLPVAVLDGPAQQERMELLRAEPRLIVSPTHEDQLQELFAGGKAVLVVSADTPVRYLFDPEHPQAVHAREIIDDRLQRGLGREDPLQSQDEPMRARGTRYIEFFIPGLLGMSIMSSSLWGIGWTIVQTRRRKLLKQLLATPMRKSHYLVSQVAGRLFFLGAEVLTIVLFAALAFKVTLGGSVLALLFLCLLGAMSFAGIGLLLASRTQNAETVSGLINLLLFPMTLLSGVFFSTARFPDWLQGPIRYLPLTALNDALRAVYNGSTLAPSALPLAVLGLLGLGCFLIALKTFKWT